MESTGTSAEKLREQIAAAEAQLRALKEQLAHVEAEEVTAAASRSQEGNGGADGVWRWPLAAEEYDRYGRQLILPGVGINGQIRLKASRVLILGAGGLGCPAAAYLAGAGVGTLGFVDGDVVEVSNLHRQISHGTSRVGQWKVDSLVAYCKEINPLPTYVPHREHLTPDNAEAIVSAYDLVLDCTDHPTSRYLASDICVLLQKSLVSASALRTDGQLIVLNTPPIPQGVLFVSKKRHDDNGKGTAENDDDEEKRPAPPCYRCVFPKPPPPDALVSCGEGGILGPVVGAVGILQALEAIKIISAGLHVPSFASHSSYSPDNDSDLSAGPPTANDNNNNTTTHVPPTLLLFSGATIGAPSFRTLKMRSRRKACFACGEGSPSRLTLDTLRSGGLDYYAAFCGGGPAAVGDVLGEEQRISAREFARLLDDASSPGGTGSRSNSSSKRPRRPLVLDVREKEFFELGSIPGAVNAPYSALHRVFAGGGATGRDGGRADAEALVARWFPPGSEPGSPRDVFVVCRVGNDSQLVVRQLLDGAGGGEAGGWRCRDIRGGIRAWRDEVDGTMPFL